MKETTPYSDLQAACDSHFLRVLYRKLAHPNMLKLPSSTKILCPDPYHHRRQQHQQQPSRKSRTTGALRGVAAVAAAVATFPQDDPSQLCTTGPGYFRGLPAGPQDLELYVPPEGSVGTTALAEANSHEPRFLDIAEEDYALSLFDKTSPKKEPSSTSFEGL